MVLAAVPDTPSTGPTSDSSVTDNSKILVNYGPQLTSENGGSDILSYEIQMDDGNGGDFISLQGYTSDSLDSTYTIQEGITSGGLYRFRYRSKNVNGWSSYSPITYIRAATVPLRPPAPTFSTATATTVTLTLSPSLDDKGSDITSYQLWVNTGSTSTVYNQITAYDGSSLSYTVLGTDGITGGTIYKFKYLAVNSYGVSDFSDELDAGVSSFPAQPSAPTKDSATSTNSSITLVWTTSADTELPVLGYKLNMDDGYNGAFTTIYNGLGYPNVLTYTKTQLVTGLTYRFTLQALNFNGESTASSEASYIICTTPTSLADPVLSSVSKTAMTVSWSAPSSNGGCSITSYHMQINDGAGGVVFTEQDAGTIANNPSLRTHTLSFTGADTSKSYVIYMQADNVVGTIDSNQVTFVLAAVPDAPSTAPTLDFTSTTAYSMIVNYAAMLTSENGGSAILSYELLIYNTTISAWTSVVGGSGAFSLQNTETVTSGIEKGKTYQYKYRAWNINGAGPYSSVGYLTAA